MFKYILPNPFYKNYFFCIKANKKLYNFIPTTPTSINVHIQTTHALLSKAFPIYKLNNNPGVRYPVDPLWLLGGLPVIHLCIKNFNIASHNIIHNHQ